MSLHESTSWSLVMGAAGAVPEDRERFSRRYEPLVRAYLSHRWRVPRDHERVHDASQEVFLRCFQPGGALQRVDPSRGAGFRAYLRGVVRNVAAEIERRDERRPTVPLLGESDIQERDRSDATASRAFDRAWAETITSEAWKLVADRLRKKRSGALRFAVLKLCYADGLPPREVARRLGVADLKDVHRIMKTGRYQFRIALLAVMANYYPGAEPKALEDKCRELLNLL